MHSLLAWDLATRFLAAVVAPLLARFSSWFQEADHLYSSAFRKFHVSQISGDSLFHHVSGNFLRWRL